MPIKPISFGTTTNPNRNDTQGVLINCYAENLGGENEGQWALYACDGYEYYLNLSNLVSSPAKAMLAVDDTTLYVVTGYEVKAVTGQNNVTSLGALTSTGHVYMARNRKEPNPEIGIVTDDGQFLMIVPNVGLQQPIVDPDIGTFNSICGIDGYFVFTKSNGEWYISSIDDGATIDELEFAKANTNPDTISRGIARGRDLLICGPQSIEFYQNTGATDFPFERTTSISVGVAYPAAMVCLSAISDGGTQDVVIFPSNNSDGSYAGVAMLTGYQPRTISPNALDRAILAEPFKSSIRAFTHTRNGQVFYTITGSSFTWEYSASLGFWHQRKSANSSVWNVGNAATFKGDTIYADRSNGYLYRADSFLVPGSASNITLRHSNNGGLTWSPVRTKSVGTSKNKRVRFPQLGTSKEDGKVLEVTFSNAIVEYDGATSMQFITPPIHSFPQPMVFDALYVNITSGTSQTASAKGFVNLSVDVTVVEA